MAFSDPLTGWGYLRGTLDAKSATAQTIATTPNNGLTFYPNRIFVRSKAASAITVEATLSLGITAASYVDILAATAMTNAKATGTFVAPLNPIAGTGVAPNTAVKANVSVAATGTSQTLEVTIWGFWA